MMILSTLQQQFPSFAINGDGSTISLLSLAIFIVAIIARYMLFIKMGEEGWKSLIPFYNRYVLFCCIRNQTGNRDPAWMHCGNVHYGDSGDKPDSGL